METDNDTSRPGGLDRQVALWGTATMVAHTVITTLHTVAHLQLDVFLNLWQNAYVAVVIVIGPIAAGIALWTKHQRAGAWGVLLTMAGSLLFAGFFHFVHISEDHVAHLSLLAAEAAGSRFEGSGPSRGMIARLENSATAQQSAASTIRQMLDGAPPQARESLVRALDAIADARDRVRAAQEAVGVPIPR